MAASLADIEAAFFDALAKINPVAAYGATPGTARESRVRYIGRWSGEPLRVSQAIDFYRAAIEKEVDGKSPSILLGFDGETVEPRPNAVQTMSGFVETVGTSTWSVLCVVRETRGIRPTMQGVASGGAADVMGVYDLSALVEAALVNLSIDGLYRSSNIRAVDARPFLISHGELYVLCLRYNVRRVMLDAREEGTDAVWDALGQTPFAQMNASINLYPADLAGDVPYNNPVVEVTAYPGGLEPLSPPRPPPRCLTSWFDASAINGMAEDNTPKALPSDSVDVPIWRDRQSGLWLVAQPDADLQPDRSDVSAVPYVQFSLTNTLYGSLDWVPVDAQARTVAIVVTSFSDQGATQALCGWGASSAKPLQDFDVLLQNGATYSPGVSTGTAVVSSGHTLTTGPVLVIASYDGTTVSCRVVPASGAGATGTSAVTLDTRDSRGFRIGRGGGLAARIGAILMYRVALTASETTSLLAWASTAYGVNGS